LEVAPLIRALGDHFRAVADAEAERVLRRQPALTPAQAEAVRQMAHRIAANLANGPLREVRKLASEPAGHDALRVLARTFGLELPAVAGMPSRAPATRASGD
jgi:glutamyl-tRNA reductase